MVLKEWVVGLVLPAGRQFELDGGRQPEHLEQVLVDLAFDDCDPGGRFLIHVEPETLKRISNLLLVERVGSLLNAFQEESRHLKLLDELLVRDDVRVPDFADHLIEAFNPFGVRAFGRLGLGLRLDEDLGLADQWATASGVMSVLSVTCATTRTSFDDMNSQTSITRSVDSFGPLNSV
jgi:hypothetical protein